jgi:hypothetical protein
MGKALTIDGDTGDIDKTAESHSRNSSGFCTSRQVENAFRQAAGTLQA